MTVYCFTKYEWAIWLQSVTVYFIHKTRKFYYNGIKQLLRRNKISFLDDWPLLQRLTSIERAAIIMKCERTECINVSNKIQRKKSHLLSLSFFCKLTAATVLKLCKEHFLTEKPGDEREWRSVTSRYHGSQISGSQQSFLTETAICIIERLRITQ